MGTSYTAYGIIGFKVDLKQPPKVDKIRGCDHAIPEQAKFCPECGAPAYRTVTRNVINVYEDFVLPLEQTFNGTDLRVFQGSDNSWVYMGYGGRAYQYSDVECDTKPIPDIQEVRRALELALVQLGLWDDQMASSFGLHTVMVGN